MTILASAVVSDNDHGYEAGRYVAMHALAAFQTPPNLFVALLSDTYHQPAEVARGIRSVTTAVPLIGGSSAGVLTMTGPLRKGVALLALRSSTLPGLDMTTVLEQTTPSSAWLAFASSAAIAHLLERAMAEGKMSG
ncbi:MAG: hypothetical protein HC837_07085 [Chloroflexaceae bacterium]|nr:hypothetical protein [Chloroflexaceae bacterium]